MEVMILKTASMVLGIIGGVFALLLAAGLIIGGIACFSVDSWSDLIESGNFSWYYSWNGNTWDSEEWKYELDSDDWGIDSDDDSWHVEWDEDEFPADEVASAVVAGVATLLIVTGSFALISGVLGLIGGCIVKNKNSAAGVMMIIAAALSLFAMFNIISMILFIIGGVFAFKKDTPKPAIPYPPYPPYPPQQPYYGNAQYPPYPPQQPYYGNSQYPPYPPQQPEPQQPTPPADGTEPPQQQ